MEKTNFTSRPFGRMKALFLMLFVLCVGVQTAQANHLNGVGQQNGTPAPGTNPELRTNVDPNATTTNIPVFFEDQHTAVLSVVGMNCGAMEYPFVDAGGAGAPFSDEGANQAFTICLDNPMIQSFSITFDNVTFDPGTGEGLAIFDGDDVDPANDPFIALAATGLTVAPNDVGNDGTSWLSFFLFGLDASSTSEGWRATINLNEFAPTVSCLPFTDIDGDDVAAGLLGNGIVEITDCNDDVPMQAFDVALGCGIEGNDVYALAICVNGVTVPGGAAIPVDGDDDDDDNTGDDDLDGIVDNQEVTVPGAALAVGNNEVTVKLIYLPNGQVKDSCTTNILVNITTPMVCNDDLNIGLDADCEVFITPDALLESPCAGSGANAYDIHVTLIDLHDLYCIDQGDADCEFENDDLAVLAGMDNLITNNNTASVGVSLPGVYRYSITLGDQTCWGFFHLEDKRGPVCTPALDEELRVSWDNDWDGAIEGNQNDPSGVDDLANEYVICTIVESNDRDDVAENIRGYRLWMDELEPKDRENTPNDGVFPTPRRDVLGDFTDCTGIDYIYFQDEHTEICDLTQLSGFPIDVDQYDETKFEVCDIYKRSWFAIDKGGYQSAQPCVQYVFSLRPKANAIQLQIEAEAKCEDGSDSDCFEASVAPFFMVTADVTDCGIVNFGTGSEGPINYDNICTGDNNIDLADKRHILKANTHTCKYAVSYHEDNSQIGICETESKKLRHWSVVDWCDGSRVYDEFTQLIKIVDDAAPVIGRDANGDGMVDRVPATGAIIPPTNFSLGTKFFDCEGSGNIPLLPTADNCSPDKNDVYNVTIRRIVEDQHDAAIFVNVFANGGAIDDLDLPQGRYEVTYFAEDGCSNRSQVTVIMTVVDNRAPVAICNDALNVTLTNFGGGNLQARVYPEDLDDSSFDACYDLVYRIRKADTGGDPSWDEFISLDCGDVGTIRAEILVVEDRDGDGRYPDNDGGLSSSCWGEIVVEDKDVPAIQCVNKTIDCDNPDLTSILDENPTADNTYFCGPTFTAGCPNANDVDLTMVIDLVDTPNDNSDNFIDYDESCRFGTFRRIFTAARSIDGNTRTATCEQRITVRYRADWTMTFPEDELIECVEGEDPNIPAPASITDIFDNNGCSQWGLEVDVDVFDVTGGGTDGACFKMVRTYKLINWCTWDPSNTEAAVVPRPVGPVYGTSGPNANGRAAVVLRHRSNPVTNLANIQNDIDDRNDGDGYNLLEGDRSAQTTLVPREIDSDLVFLDGNFNDAPNDAVTLGVNYFPNGSYPGTVLSDGFGIDEDEFDDGEHDLVSAEAYGYIIYRQTIKVIDNQAPVIAPIDPVVICDTLATSIGTNPTGCGTDVTICGPDVTECRPTYSTSYTVVDAAGASVASGNFPVGATSADCIDLGFLPFGIYTVTYLVEDGCGNFSEVTYTVESKDCKAPTAYCVFGLVVDLMPTGMVELWATDFDAGSFDECSNPVEVYFLDEDGNEVPNMMFTCDEVGQQVVELYAEDAQGNSAFCTTFVVVQPNDNNDGSVDPNDNCGIGALVSGGIQTEVGEAVEGVEVSLSGNLDATVETTVDGEFSFTVSPGHDYTVTPEKDINHLNGVSTFDLVLIRKHIIGVQLLDSPYKLIAADVNRTGTVTTFDMVVLRKLILNIDTEFEGNTSWRFVDATYSFPNPANPWVEAFPELTNLNDIAEDATVNFVGVKVGDVNASAIPNNLVSGDDRSNNTFNFNVANQAVKAGETFTVEFTAAEMAAISGYQFTLNYNNLDLVEVIEGVAKADNFGIFADKGMITTSWEGEAAADEVMFSLVFTAQATANLSELLNASSSLTKAEAYRNNDVLNVALDFGSTTAVNAEFALYQNTPNPFKGVTAISFNLPEAGTATVKVHDVTGKVIKLINGDFAKGLNQVTFDSQAANATGVLYYTLETANYTATKKMVIIE